MLLNDATFANARLEACKFDSCQLSNSRFVHQNTEQCQLTGVKFHQCVLTNASLGRVDASCFFINSIGVPDKQQNTKTDQLTMNLHADSWINSVAISADNRFIVSAGFDETVRLWDRKTQQPIGSPFQGYSDEINSVAISADNRFIISAGDDGSVRLWNRESQNVWQLTMLLAIVLFAQMASIMPHAGV